MATPPRRLSKRKTDAPREAIVGRAVVAKPADPRQAGHFDEPLPKWVRPCLPTLVDKPPVGPQWVHEIKWDGYRVSAYVDSGKVVIRARNGHDWTARFPAIARAAAALKVRSAVVDGEAVILDDRGRSSFAELQADLDRGASVTVLDPHVSTKGEMGHVVLTVLGMVAQMERRFIKERQREGIDNGQTADLLAHETLRLLGSGASTLRVKLTTPTQKSRWLVALSGFRRTNQRLQAL